MTGLCGGNSPGPVNSPHKGPVTRNVTIWWGYHAITLTKQNTVDRVHILWDIVYENSPLNTLRPRQNGRHFADDMFKCIFLNENVWIPIEISLKFVSRGSINNNPALFQIMAWRRPGDKPLSEPMMVSSLTQICVTRPQWVKILYMLKC